MPKMIESEKKKVLDMFIRTINLEKHHIIETPQLTFQLLYNQLQWGNKLVKDITKEELQNFIKSERTFLHQYREPERKTSYLIMTLIYSTGAGGIINCDFSPDGSLIMATSVEGILKIWDTETGQAVMILKGCIRPGSFSPNGQKFISASAGKKLKVVDLTTKQEILTLEGHTGTISYCSFSPDGKKIISADYNGIIKIWDATTGKEIAVFKTESGQSTTGPEPLKPLSYIRSQYRIPIGTMRSKEKSVNDCAISSSGKTFVSAEGGLSHTPEDLSIWDIGSARLIIKLKGHADRVISCSYSPDDKKIVSSSIDRTIRIWNAATGDEIEKIKVGSYPECVTFSPDGKKILYGTSDGTINIWDTEARKNIFNQKGHFKTISECKYSPDGKRIASASYDGTIKIWSAESEYESVDLKVDSRPVRTFSFSPDNKKVISRGRSLIHWDLERGKRIGIFESGLFLEHDCAYSPDGKHVVSSHIEQNRFLQIWDAETRTEKLKIQTTGSTYACNYSPDGSRIISAHDKNVVVWDPQTAQKITTLTGHKDRVIHCTYSPEGKRFVTVSDDGSLKIWDAVDFRELNTIKIPETKYTDNEEREYNKKKIFDFSPDGKRIICVNQYSLGYGWRFQLLILDTDGNQIDLIKISYPAQCSFSPEGKKIIVIPFIFPSPIQIINSRTRENELEIETYHNIINDFSPSPDGNQIMTSGKDGIFKIWDTSSGNELNSFYAEGPIKACTYSHDGRSLVLSDSIGNLLFLRIQGKEVGNPIITAKKLWLFHKDQGKGGWDNKFMVQCTWCGHFFTIINTILDVIRSINRDAGLTPEQSPCLELPDQAWEEPKLISECPHCHKPLKFNPFVVDNQHTL